VAEAPSATPEEVAVGEAAGARDRERPLRLLVARRDFRRLFLAVSASELGDSFHYIALMWLALRAGGPLGVVVVRLADSVPAFLFGLHGGVAADRFDRKRLMVGADLVRGAVLVPLALWSVAAGGLPLWPLVVAAFTLETASSYFAPAYGAVVPAIVGREHVQAANGLLRASGNAVSIGGWTVAAGLVAVIPIGALFAINAASFGVSALLIASLRHGHGRPLAEERPRIREGFAVLRTRRTIGIALATLVVAGTIHEGTWIGGVPALVRDTLGHGAGAFSLVMVGYATGAVATGMALAHRPVRRKARGSILAWSAYLPAYAAMAFGNRLEFAVAGAAASGVALTCGIVLLQSAAQESVPDAVLGRVSGLISLAHRGIHATGLMLVAPWFAVFSPQSIFAVSAAALPLVSLAGLAVTSRAAGARAPVTDRSP
jgi:hypothetical protein